MAGMTQHEKDRTIEVLLGTPEGRMKLAASMQNPLRERLDYEGVFRRAAVVDPLPQGALPYYDRDVDVPAIVIGEEGQTPETIVKGKRLFIPLFELASNPKIPFTQLKERRYNLIDRAQDKAKQDLQAVENRDERWPDKQNPTKKGRLWLINEPVEEDFNAVLPIVIVSQQPVNP